MAEVFGIVAGALGALDVSAKGIRHLELICTTWKHAPAEVFALHNELQDLCVVLDRVKEAGKAIEAASSKDHVLVASLATYLRKAEEYARQINDTLDLLKTQKDIKKKYRWLRQQGKVEDFKLRIRGVRESINSLLLSHGVIKSTQVELDLVSMSTSMAQQHQTVTTGLNALATSADNTQDALKAIHSDIQGLSTLVTTSADSTQETLGEVHSDFQGLSTLVTTSADSTQDTLGAVHSDVQGLSTLVTTSSQRVASSIEQTRVEMRMMFQDLVSQSNARFDRPTTTGESNPPGKPVQNLQLTQLLMPRFPSQSVQFTTTRRRVCHEDCDCPCHSSAPSQSHVQLPQVLSLIIGSLFLQFSGWPARFSTCSPGCKSRRQTNMRFTYIFPVWLLQCSILFYLQKVAGRKPEMFLILKNRVSIHDVFFAACHRGDLETVQMIYKEAPWRIRDVRDEDGISPLFWAVTSTPFPVDVIKFLISVGGDVDGEDDKSRSPRKWIASRLMLFNNLSLLDLERFQLLRMREFLDEVSLPELTQSILQLPGSSNLRDVVFRQPLRCLEEANARDELGLTPIHWACRTGNSEALQLLVNLGADVNTRGSDSATPLHQIAGFRTGSALACINILIQAGAKLKPNDQGQTALHLAGRFATAEVAQALIDSGGDLEHRDLNGQAPVHVAAYNCNAPVLRTLLDNGAGTEGVTRDGHTPLHGAVMNNAHECIQELLSRGANHCRINNNGASIIHLAAAIGDVRTLGILAQHDLSGLDINAEDRWGRTPEDILHHRGLTVELENAFYAMLEAVQGRYWDQISSGDGDASESGDSQGSLRVESEEESDIEGDAFFDAEDGS